MIGTKITFVAVRNAFFEGVVYFNPTICNANPANNAVPKTKPHNSSSLVVVVIFLFARSPIKTAAIKNLKNIIVNGLNSFKAISLATKPPPQIIVTIISPIIPNIFFICLPF